MTIIPGHLHATLAVVFMLQAPSCNRDYQGSDPCSLTGYLPLISALCALVLSRCESRSDTNRYITQVYLAWYDISVAIGPTTNGPPTFGPQEDHQLRTLLVPIHGYFCHAALEPWCSISSRSDSFRFCTAVILDHRKTTAEPTLLDEGIVILCLLPGE